MRRVLAAALDEHVGEEVTLQGWLSQVRRLRGVAFLILRDRSGTAQVVVRDPGEIERVSDLRHESVLSLTGRVAPRGDGRPGAELVDPALEVLAAASEPPPFDLFRPTLELPLPTLLDYAPLSLRHPRRRAVFEIAAALAHGFRESLRHLEFVEIHTPKLVAAATEGGANVFPVGYFDRTAYLAQSPQFYKQMMVGVFERVFEVGPVFRAEPHDTPRHLNEYVSLDAEFGFIDDHRTVMVVLRTVMAGMLDAVRDEAARALALLEVPMPALPDSVPTLHFTEAQRLLQEMRGEPGPSEDLAPADELALGAWAKKEFGSDFLFVEGYPASARPFYTHPDPSRPGYTLGFDLLFRGLELVTGGQRLHRYEDYLAALRQRGLDPGPFSGYLQAFRYGMPPHGGFAIGLERFVGRLIGLKNLREATLFPRDLSRLDP